MNAAEKKFKDLELKTTPVSWGENNNATGTSLPVYDRYPDNLWRPGLTVYGDIAPRDAGGNHSGLFWSGAIVAPHPRKKICRNRC